MTKNWEEIPKGLCLIRMFHERTGKHHLHFHVKAHDGPWYVQPRFPGGYSDGISGYREFWTWAEQNLPIWDYPEIVKGHE